jgi:hypothetical protein
MLSAKPAPTTPQETETGNSEEFIDRQRASSTTNTDVVIAKGRNFSVLKG